ncbi:MAG: hypothetical protein RL722_2490 [Pseudomonadota bacterium]|jgi:hypothetical protein
MSFPESPSAPTVRTPARPYVEDAGLAHVPGEVFISYKREDELRAARLVRALEHHGLVVWWDRGVSAGENWRARIQAHLEKASTVVVCWSRHTQGVEGRFVQADAEAALVQGKLLPVQLDDTPLPPHWIPPGDGMVGAVAAVDLGHWGRGWVSGPLLGASSGRLGAPFDDPFLLDLIALLRARRDERPLPAPRGRRLRLQRRLAWGGAAGLSLGAVLGLQAGLAEGAGAWPQRACGAELAWAQPTLSDTCAALGLGDRPTAAERLAWSSRPRSATPGGTPQSCEWLRNFVQLYPQGHYRATAQALLDQRQVDEQPQWTAVERPLTLASWPAASGSDRAEAEQAARAAAQTQADQACAALVAQAGAASAPALLRMRQARLVEAGASAAEPAGSAVAHPAAEAGSAAGDPVSAWQCERQSTRRGKVSWSCRLDAHTVCEVEQGAVIRTERCE